MSRSLALLAAPGRRRWLQAAAASIAGGLVGDLVAGEVAPAAPPGAASAPAAGTPLDDLMPAFWHAYDASRALPIDGRAQRLADAFFTPAQALYRQAGARVPDAGAVAPWLPKFDPLAPAARAVSAVLAAELQSNAEKFRSALPDFDPAVSPVFALPSLFAFDAHLEPGGATLPLFFGPDGIVRYHGAQPDLRVLFAHEIYHCYQAQRNPSLSLAARPTVYGNLWIEGVATWASAKLNPDASLLHVLLDDEALLRDGPRTARRVAAALLARLDATDDAALESFFSFGSPSLDWPARAGYYVGYLAAHRIGATLTLREMAALPTPQVRERLLPALQAIRDGDG
jgi:hypothetical protein